MHAGEIRGNKVHDPSSIVSKNEYTCMKEQGLIRLSSSHE